VRALPRRAEASTRRLLRILFLRLDKLSDAAGIERTRVLRWMKPCCGDALTERHPLERRQHMARFVVRAVRLAAATP